jgi:hypothetical protein
MNNENIVESYNDFHRINENEESKNDVSESIILVDNEDYLIVVPKNYEDSVKYGKGAKWMPAYTGYGGEYSFDLYNEQGTLYYIINKNLDSDDSLSKIGIYIDSRNDSKHIYDVNDYTLKWEDLPKEIFDHLPEEEFIHRD